MHDQRTVFLALYIEQSWLADTDRNFVRCAHPAFFRQSGVAITGQIRKLRQDLVERIGSQEYDAPKESEQIILDLTTAIAHQFADWSSPPRDTDHGSNDFRIRRAIRHMQ
jgi:hypothetical protein